MRPLLTILLLLVAMTVTLPVQANMSVKGPNVVAKIVTKSHEGVTYGDEIQLMTETSAAPGAQIYYRVDNAPDRLYTAPIKIDRANMSIISYAKYPTSAEGERRIDEIMMVGAFEGTIATKKAAFFKVTLVEGIVTAKTASRLYVADRTATIAVLGDYPNVIIGQSVSVRGIVNEHGQIAHDVMVTKNDQPTVKVIPTTITLAQVPMRLDELVRLDHVEIEYKGQMMMKQGATTLPMTIATWPMMNQSLQLKRIVGVFEKHGEMIQFIPRTEDGLQYERTLNLQQVKTNTIIIEQQNHVKLPDIPFSGNVIIKANVALQGDLSAATLHIQNSVTVQLFGQLVKKIVIMPGSKPLILAGERLTIQQIAEINAVGGRVQFNKL